MKNTPRCTYINGDQVGELHYECKTWFISFRSTKRLFEYMSESKSRPIYNRKIYFNNELVPSCFIHRELDSTFIGIKQCFILKLGVANKEMLTDEF